MRKLNLFIFASIIIFIPYIDEAIAEEPCTSGVGRFQIVAGTHTFPSLEFMAREMEKKKQTSFKIQGGTLLRFSKIFRIDTCTGETWYWHPGGVPKGALGGKWEKIQENLKAHGGEGGYDG